MMSGGRFPRIASERRRKQPKPAKATKGTASHHSAVAKRSTGRFALSARGRELIAYVVNAGALGVHAEKCDLETMATELGLTVGGLRRTVSALSRAGYFTVEGIGEYVYPTKKSLLVVNPRLSRSEAASFLRKLHRTRA